MGELLRKGKMPLIVFTGFIHSTAGSIHTAALHPNTDNLIFNLVSMHSYIAIHANICALAALVQQGCTLSVGMH